MANIMPSGMDYPRELRGAIAKGHHKIGGTTLADCKMDILVAYIIVLKGNYICDPVILIHLP